MRADNLWPTRVGPVVAFNDFSGAAPHGALITYYLFNLWKCRWGIKRKEDVMAPLYFLREIFSGKRWVGQCESDGYPGQKKVKKRWNFVLDLGTRNCSLFVI